MINITRIDGDAAVTRNVAVGGDATVEGSVLLGHDLIVRGRLDARSIRGCDRGLFASEDALMAAWPNPEEGWWAMVGGTVPAMVYVADSTGRWTSTGQMSGEYGGEQGSDKQLAAMQLEISRMSAALEQARAVADQALAQAHYPSVVYFSSVVSKATVSGGKSDLSSTSSGAAIVYIENLATFALNTLSIVNGIARPVYCLDWVDRHLFVDDSNRPHRGKLYVCSTSAVLYIATSGGLIPACQP